MSSEWAWSDGDFASSSRLNMASNQRMTGGGIAAIINSEVEPGVQVFCTESGSGFTEGNLYERDVDNNGWHIVGLRSHSHTGPDSGGTLADVGIANLTGTFSLNKRYSRVAEWWVTPVNGGTATDNAASGRIDIASGTTLNGSVTMSNGGGRRLNFAQPSAFEAYFNVSSNTNFQVKLGVGAEDINGGNLTPPKYGIEMCSTSGINILLFSSDGTTRSTLATSAPVVAATSAYRLICTPGTSIEFYVNDVLIATKTTFVPAVGSTQFNDTFRVGVKTTLAAENKQINWYGVQVEGSVI